MIKKWKICPIHQAKSKLEILSLGSMWSFLHEGRSLKGAHSSLMDARAQSDLVLHQHFVPYLNRTNSLSPIDKIFGANKLNKPKKEMEPIRPVHGPWTKLTTESEIK